MKEGDAVYKVLAFDSGRAVLDRLTDRVLEAIRNGERIADAIDDGLRSTIGLDLVSPSDEARSGDKISTRHGIEEVDGDLDQDTKEEIDTLLHKMGGRNCEDVLSGLSKLGDILDDLPERKDVDRLTRLLLTKDEIRDIDSIGDGSLRETVERVLEIRGEEDFRIEKVRGIWQLVEDLYNRLMGRNLVEDHEYLLRIDRTSRALSEMLDVLGEEPEF